MNLTTNFAQSRECHLVTILIFYRAQNTPDILSTVNIFNMAGSNNGKVFISLTILSGIG